jgi:ferredoxin
MDRRAFFQQAFRNTGEKLVKLCDARVGQRAAHWIRPPFAQDELAFLLACTRCGACVTACPHGVIFPLAPRLGISVAGTPALNLLHKGCHLCDGWPCVAACEPGALKMDAGTMPRFGPAPSPGFKSTRMPACPIKARNAAPAKAAAPSPARSSGTCIARVSTPNIAWAAPCAARHASFSHRPSRSRPWRAPLRYPEFGKAGRQSN